MQPNVFNERRGLIRVPLVIPVKYVNLDAGITGSAQARDISPKGLGLWVDGVIPEKLSVMIYFNLPDDTQNTQLEAKLVWISGEIKPGRYMAGFDISGNNLDPAAMLMLAAKARALYFREKYKEWSYLLLQK